MTRSCFFKCVQLLINGADLGSDERIRSPPSYAKKHTVDSCLKQCYSSHLSLGHSMILPLVNCVHIKHLCAGEGTHKVDNH